MPTASLHDRMRSQSGDTEGAGPQGPENCCRYWWIKIGLYYWFHHPGDRVLAFMTFQRSHTFSNMFEKIKWALTAKPFLVWYYFLNHVYLLGNSYLPARIEWNHRGFQTPLKWYIGLADWGYTAWFRDHWNIIMTHENPPQKNVRVDWYW